MCVSDQKGFTAFCEGYHCLLCLEVSFYLHTKRKTYFISISKIISHNNDSTVGNPKLFINSGGVHFLNKGVRAFTSWQNSFKVNSLRGRVEGEVKKYLYQLKFF